MATGLSLSASARTSPGPGTELSAGGSTTEGAAGHGSLRSGHRTENVCSPNRDWDEFFIRAPATHSFLSSSSRTSDTSALFLWPGPGSVTVEFQVPGAESSRHRYPRNGPASYSEDRSTPVPRCFQVQKTVRARTVNLKDTGTVTSPRLLAVVSSWSTCPSQRSKPQLNMTGGPLTGGPLTATTRSRWLQPADADRVATPAGGGPRPPRPQLGPPTGAPAR